MVGTEDDADDEDDGVCVCVCVHSVIHNTEAPEQAPAGSVKGAL